MTDLKNPDGSVPGGGGRAAPIVDTWHSTGIVITTVQPTPNLRWRAGALQQEFIESLPNGGMRFAWRDVPSAPAD